LLRNLTISNDIDDSSAAFLDERAFDQFSSKQPPVFETSDDCASHQKYSHRFQLKLLIDREFQDLNISPKFHIAFLGNYSRNF
jgi:hypothetical protein